jgi:3'(2'), 5'-bisphosphate nucleotidase
LEQISSEQLRRLADTAESAARNAGQVLLSFYRKELAADLKKDGSPVTLADRSSHDTIVAMLDKTGIPVVSEEGVETLMNSRYYWLVDPLDGTKDFLAANDEFAVNIALMDMHRPVIGVVHAPALNELYLGITALKYCLRKQTTDDSLSVEKPKSAGLRMAVSRFHDHEDAATFARDNQVSSLVPVGSALKYGRIAFGDIDVYPRLVGTSEWDTAAGQAILESSGGVLADWHTGLPLKYGKTNRRNGRFVAFRGPYAYTDFSYQYFNPEIFL